MFPAIAIAAGAYLWFRGGAKVEKLEAPRVVPPQPRPKTIDRRRVRFPDTLRDTPVKAVSPVPPTHKPISDEFPISDQSSIPILPKRAVRRNADDHQMPMPTADERQLYFEKQLDRPGAYGDPGTVQPQDVPEPIARDVAWQARQQHEPTQVGPADKASAAILDKQSANGFNVNQPLGAIGLNQDRLAKLVVTADDVNELFDDPKPLKKIDN